MISSSAACSGFDGEARVEANFITNECEEGTEKSELDGYNFDADWVSTERAFGVLFITIHKFQVVLEETDALTIRVRLNDLLEQGVLVEQDGSITRADPNQNLALPTSMARADANASLSLFQTCPEFPTHNAVSGQLNLTELILQEDPIDTGASPERISGTLTATLTRSNAEGATVATLSASFDFQPPKRPLAVFK